MKKLLIAIIILAAAGGAAWFYLSPDKAKTAAAAAAAAGPVTVEARKGTVSVVVEGAAIVEPYRQVTLRSPASSVLTGVARSGEKFDQGGIVASLDDAVLRNALGQAEILLAQAEVDAQRAKLAAERAAKDVRDKKTLLDNRALSPDQYAAAEEAVRNADLALEAANLKVKQTRLSVDRSRRDLTETRIRAPFAGTVLKTYVSAGDLVSANAQVALFGDISRLRLIAEVDEFDIGKISIGQTVTIGGDSVGPDPIRSKVENISPMAEIVNNISIFEVSAIVNNTEGKLRPGMSADFSILIKSDKGIVVPAKSVSTVRGRSYIEVIENGETVKKRVEIGADDGINIVILEGLDEGAAVVIPGAVPVSAAPQPAASGEKSVLPITIPGAGGSK
jgi:RND family efflux transporter MFP subunit